MKHLSLLLAILAVAIAFRLALLYGYETGSPWVYAITLNHAEMGRNVLHGRGWVIDSGVGAAAARRTVETNQLADLADVLPQAANGNYTRMSYAHAPGYSLWLAAGYLLGGEERFIYSQWMQVIADALACLALYLIGTMLRDRGAGIIAAALYAVSPVHAQLATMPVQAALDSAWFLYVALGGVACWHALESRRPVWPALAITVLATVAGAAMNSTAFVLPAAMCGVAIMTRLIWPGGFRLALWLAVAQLLVFAVLLPWAFQNKKIYDQFTPIRGTSGQVIWSTWGDLPNPWGLGLDDKYYWNWVYENCPEPCGSAEREAMTRGYLASEVMRSPAFPRFLMTLVVHNTGSLTKALHIAQGQIRTVVAEPFRGRLTVLLQHLDTAFARTLLYAGGLGAIVVLCSGRRRIVAGLIALAPSIFLISFSLATYVSERKTAAAFGIGCVFAGIGLSWLLTQLLRVLECARRRRAGSSA